jgi:hypothetical protein
MFGEITFASPDAASITPKAPTNCQRDQGANPPSAAIVSTKPRRFRNESRKTRTRPLNARPVPCLAFVSRGSGSGMHRREGRYE